MPEEIGRALKTHSGETIECPSCGSTDLRWSNKPHFMNWVMAFASRDAIRCCQCGFRFYERALSDVEYQERKRAPEAQTAAGLTRARCDKLVALMDFKPAPPEIRCPVCGRGSVRYAVKYGFWDNLMRLFGKETFRCLTCQNRFHAPVREAKSVQGRQDA